MATETQYHLTEPQLLSEQQLVEEAKKNPARFDVLYNKYYEQILAFVYQRVEEKDDAFDITSQVFMKALLNLSRYNFTGVPFSAWLYRIAINELNLLFRSNKVQRALNVDIDSVGDIMQEMEEENKEEKHNQLLESLCELEEEDLQLIEMRYFEKRAFKEIGEILSITENNAKVKVYRILEKLKTNIIKKGTEKRN